MAAEGVAGAHPAGVGAEVNLGGEGGGDAHRPVLLCDNFSVFLYDFRPEGGGKPHPLGPLGSGDHFFGLPAGGVTGAVAGVGGEADRDAEGGGLGQRLEVVVPAGEGLDIAGVGQQYRADPVLGDKFFLSIGQFIGRYSRLIERLAAVGAAKPPAGRDRLVGGEEGEPRHCLGGEPGGEVLRPFFGGKTPVLIGEQLPCPGQVLEGEAVLLDDRRVHHAEGFAPVVFDDGVIAVKLFLIGHVPDSFLMRFTHCILYKGYQICYKMSRSSGTFCTEIYLCHVTIKTLRATNERPKTGLPRPVSCVWNG